MKKILFILLITNCSLLIAQWQPDVRLTNDPANSWTSSNNAWCIASSGNFAHVVWRDTRDGNDEIYYKRSTDGGVSWGADIRLTNNPAISQFPSVSVSGQVVHVVWKDQRNPGGIYYKRSTDGGVTWGADTWNSAGDNSNFPSVSVSGQAVHVVWYDLLGGNGEIYYKRSTDGGVSWEADIRLTNNSAPSSVPSVSVSGQVVHVVWVDFRDGNYEIYYKRSTDGGVSWGADTRLTSDPAGSGRPSVSVSGQVVHVVWMDDRDGNYEIYYKRSTNEGVSWETDTRLTNAPNNSWYPSVSVSGQVVHVVWYDNRDGNNEIYYKRDPTGNPVGIINISSEIPNQFSLSQNYPNPFNPTTKIQFALPKSSFVTLVVYDALGRISEIIVKEQLNAGTYEVDWSADKFSSGVYYYKLVAEDYTETKKMVLIK